MKTKDRATIGDLLDWAETSIKKSKAVDLWRPSDARVNAEDLLGDILQKKLTMRDLDRTVEPSDERKFRNYVARRVSGEPVAFILGYTEFRKLRLTVSPGVFVPRNSSEFLATEAMKKVRRRRNPVAVDVATGTGPVALAIANEVPVARVYGLDIWVPSLKVARKNARANRISNVQFLTSDMLSKLPSGLRGDVDVFTIHPPYVAKKHVGTLPKEILDYEPVVSLSDNSDDGLELVRRLADDAPEWLAPGGWVLVEVSPDLSRKVGAILRRAGFRDVRSKRDSLGATRVIGGRT